MARERGSCSPTITITPKPTDPMNMINRSIRIAGRVILGGIAGAVVWNLGIRFLFGPAQYFLANPEYQSQKFIDVFLNVEPLPIMFEQPVAFYAGFVVVGIAYSTAYHLVSGWIPGSTFRKGLRFGLISWLLAIWWFEFYMPWNVMHEPLVLVLLELVIWIVVQMLVALSIAYTHHFLQSRNL